MSSCWRMASPSSWCTLACRLREAACAPEISAIAFASSWRSTKSFCDSLNIWSFSALSAPSWFFRSASLAPRSCSALLAEASTLSVWPDSLSSRRFTAWYRRRASSSAIFFSSMRAASPEFSARLRMSEAAEAASSFFSTSSSSLNSCSRCCAPSASWRFLASTRSSSWILPRTSAFSPSCIFSRSRCWATASAFSSFWRRASAYRSPRALISSSRRRSASMASCHCCTSRRRSACSERNSSAERSSSICFAWVSVASASSCRLRSSTAWFIFSICSVRSLILASSARVYFCSARLSSSFCLAASAHCSSSSWFQFICSLNRSSRSLPRKTAPWAAESRSCASSMARASRLASCTYRAVSRWASWARCSSVWISLSLDSSSAFVCVTSCRTLRRCSSITFTRLWNSSSSISSLSARVSAAWISACTARAWALANSGSPSAASAAPSSSSSSSSLGPSAAPLGGFGKGTPAAS
mmetsp:Transcript_41489/g.68041  ORF Transcript_41489/g.68041 Transcript_41489/m.68041 type:complete len:472 (+) Transcript_41489:1582-2997(+)